MIPQQRTEAESPALKRLLQFCKIHRYAKRRPVIRPGDPADTLYYIIEGSVTVSMTNDEGDDIILGYLNRGDFIGELGLFLPRRNREVSVRTRSPCTIAQIGYDQLERLAQRELREVYADIVLLVGRHVAERLVHTTRKVGHLAFLDTAGRIAHTLLELCRQPDALTHPDGMQIHISRTELARIVGCSREMVGRVLKNMEAQGLISAHGKTLVVFGDREELLDPDRDVSLLRPAD